MRALTKRDVLRRYFGYGEFRPGQEKLIDAILSGRDCLGIMPTGGGKSICYQVPALLLRGVTIVVSPLISLMTDQVLALRENGVEAAYINSTQTAAEYGAVLDGLRAGRYKLLYIAPERLETAGFRNVISQLDVPLVAVDEAHCVSQWGQDFRPSYLRIAPAIASLPRRPTVAAFTATATERVRGDITRLLELREPEVLVTGFDRPNLYLEVRQPRNKDRELLALLRERRGRSGIVYCATRSAVEEVCGLLRSQGYSAVRYHAGLSEQERAGAQEAFQYDEANIMVATNAFGMGIDKSNVSFVIHYNMPKSIDAYYQEAGRAGRDGQPADCILLYSGRDTITARYLIEHGESAAPDTDIQRLNAMVGYCKTERCLRGYILSYFGQEHPPGCGNCGNCLADCVERDITTEAQMILSCIERVRSRLGYNVGRGLICDVLRGSASAKVTEKGLEGVSTYGLMADTSRDRLNRYIDALTEQGYIALNGYQALCCTQKAADVLFGGTRVAMPERVGQRSRTEPYAGKYTPPRRRASSAARPSPAPDRPKPEYSVPQLYEELRRVRARAAGEAGVPAYVVFSNASLQAMAQLAPLTREEFLAVPGVGEVKAGRFGELFISAIREFMEDL